MYKYLDKVLEVKQFNTKQLKIKGITELGKIVYLYTTSNGEWKQSDAEFWEK